VGLLEAAAGERSRLTLPLQYRHLQDNTDCVGLKLLGLSSCSGCSEGFCFMVILNTASISMEKGPLEKLIVAQLI
jgi:hypothetical protein